MKNHTMKDLYITHTSPYDDIDLVLGVVNNKTSIPRRRVRVLPSPLDVTLYTLAMISLGVIIGLLC